MATLAKKLFNKVQKDKFFVHSTYGELLDLACALKDEDKEVVFYVPDADHKKIGDGIVEKAENWHDYLGQGWIFVIDGCESAHLQEWLRAQGELVVGTNETMAKLEDDRQVGQEWFKSMEFKQPDSQNFTDFDKAIDFIIDNEGQRYIFKQNGSAPKHLNHMGKFESGIDMLHHLNQLKKEWNENEWGLIDFDLMQVVEGTEIAASAFFNGRDWLRNSKGKVVGWLNGEEKKQSDGGLGSTTGETGTTFFAVDEDNEIFKDIMLRPEIAKKLKDTDYRGVFDINGCLTDDGFVCFEPTSRFGIPATSYEFIEGLETPTSELLSTLAKGEDNPIEIHPGIGMVIVVSAPPFPVEADLNKEATSIGEKLWILKDGDPVKDFSKEQKRHIHLENFFKNEEGDYKVATKNGYLLTVTGRGEDLKDVRNDLLEYIKDNLHIADMNFRQDIGKRLENFL